MELTRFTRRFNVFVASAFAVYALGALFGRANYVLTAAVSHFRAVSFRPAGPASRRSTR